jgi:hypothetical protein
VAQQATRADQNGAIQVCLPLTPGWLFGKIVPI